MDRLKLLAVFAHPDDESMGMGGTLAKYAAEGVETHLVCATRGERGWFGPEEQNPGPGALGQVRTKELENAVNALGMQGLYFLDYSDGEVDRADHTEAIGRIVTHIRRVMPQVVVTFPPDGNYGHPDHIAIGQFASAAVLLAADASYRDSENFAPHRVSKLYYMVDSENFKFSDALCRRYNFPCGRSGARRSRLEGMDDHHAHQHGRTLSRGLAGNPVSSKPTAKPGSPGGNA
jgi:LmbE family N-acetylglucosaminyl deacetylase